MPSIIQSYPLPSSKKRNEILFHSGTNQFFINIRLQLSRKVGLAEGIIVTRVALPDAQVDDPHCLVTEAAGVFQAAVEAELGSDHDSVVVEFDVAAGEVHELVSVPDPMDCEVDASVDVECDLLADLHPLPTERLNRNLGQNSPIVFKLHVASGSEGQVRISHVGPVQLDLVKMAELV